MFLTERPQLSDSLKRKQKIFYAYLVIQIILSICKVVASPAVAISEILSCLLFYCAIAHMNFCLFAFYAIILLF